ncbi:MAG: Glu/Leu/Phe/Val dehydrogenase [Parachlamydiales bacterium]|nr:Glu/Leu/Phe/Val dehydrogenase [Verrucomicrobiota bacterium]MBX3718469.1 Glu/Leu/Phe/Val dehydrogenase [Candidatus Acheromyda pituitae]
MALILEESLVLEEIEVPGYERVVRIKNEQAGLNAIVCIHTTGMGPALGGTRIFPYTTFDAALNDVMRLSKGMTYKSALSECGWGGGKSVIIADPKKDKSEELLFAFGQAVDQLRGDYICAEDVGCSPQDVMVISRATPYVVGLPHDKSSGNPSPYTAWGTYRGIQSVLKKLTGSDSVEGKVVAIQGMGSVGASLAEFLFWNGAKIIMSDIDAERCSRWARQFDAQVVAPDEILKVTCDVLAPCAMGGVINAQTIPHLRCSAIAGCANNQLLKDQDADELMARGILYAPDFVINAGGLINVTQELEGSGYNPSVARNKIHKLYDQLMVIYDIAEQNRCSTHKAAMALGDYRLKYRIGKRQNPPVFHHATNKK